MVLCAFATCVSAQDTAQAEPVKYSEMQLNQFISGGPDFLHSQTSSEFTQLTTQACTVGSNPPAAPLIAAFAGILIDWMFSRVASGINKKLKKRIEAYSESYSNSPVYRDMFTSTAWNANKSSKTGKDQKESCVVVQRVSCKVAAISVANGSATCNGVAGSELGLAVAIKLRNEGEYLRVLPVALELKRMKAKHDGKEAAVSASVRIDAPVWSESSAGARWTSGDLGVASHKCVIPKGGVATTACVRKFVVDEAAWSKSAVLPMPPKTVQAIVFTIGEVGEPSQGLKGFAEFMDANHGVMSGALSEAFQKKIGLKE